MQADIKNIRSLSKILGSIIVILGAIALLKNHASNPLLIGLFILLITQGPREDERSARLKASSIQIALIIGFATKLIANNLHDHNVINFQLVAINHFLILVFSIAIILHYILLKLA